MLASFRARARSRTTALENEVDDDDPCRRSILPFPAKLHASNAKLNLKAPPPPALPYTSPVSQDDPSISDDCRERSSRGEVAGSVDIPAYRLNLDGAFDGDDRGGDEPGGGGKKRKVPASAVSGASSDPETMSSLENPAERKSAPFVTRHHEPSTIARSHMFHKLLFERRKAQILLLQQDALELLETTSAKSKAAYKTTLIDKLAGSDLKQLWKGLETVAAGKWPWDRMAWRGKAIIDDPLITHTPNGIEASPPEAKKAVVGRWSSRTWKKARFNARQPPRTLSKRVGWTPEGSFEVEYKSIAAQMPRIRQQLLAQLREYVQELLTVSIGPNPSAATKRTAAAHRKAMRKLPAKSAVTPAAAAQSAITAPQADSTTASPSKSAASEASDVDNASNDAGSGGGKKRKGRKKRSALANNSNPHHVKNYIPSRVAPPAPMPDPALSSLLSGLLFPMPTRFLNARPAGSTEGASKAGADDFICASCEYSLFFGDKESMRRAIAKRKRELRRRERVLKRARGVMEGRKQGTSGHYHGGHDDEEDWCDEEDNGCTCGGAARDREARERARKGRIKDEVH